MRIKVFNAGPNTKVLLAGDGRTRSVPRRQDGSGGKMQGRKVMISATWYAPKQAFSNPNGILLEGKGTADLPLAITANHKFCGYNSRPDFGSFHIFKHALDEPKELEEYKRHLDEHCLGLPLPGSPRPIVLAVPIVDGERRLTVDPNDL